MENTGGGAAGFPSVLAACLHLLPAHGAPVGNLSTEGEGDGDGRFPGCPFSLEMTDGLSCTAHETGATGKQLPGKAIGSSGLSCCPQRRHAKGAGAFWGGTRVSEHVCAGGVHAGSPMGGGQMENPARGTRLLAVHVCVHMEMLLTNTRTHRTAMAGPIPAGCGTPEPHQGPAAPEGRVAAQPLPGWALMGAPPSPQP